MKNNKIPKINGFKQEFEILSFSKDFKDLRLSDYKNNTIPGVCLDLQTIQRLDLNKIKRGMRLIAIASPRKVKYYNNSKVITHLLNVLPPIQTDLEDFL